MNSVNADHLTIRHFFRATDEALPRTMPFHDVMADRTDIAYYLHIVGSYPGPTIDLQRPYIMKPTFRTPQCGAEVWIVRSCDHILINAAAICAHIRGIPLLMWSERSGITYQIRSVRDAVRVFLRKFLLPILFIPYRYRTTLLCIGSMAVADRCALAGHTNAKVFLYPNHIADACLGLPLKSASTLPLLLYVGGFTHRKALDLIMTACEVSWGAGVKFRMRYVGNGPFLPELIAHTERSNGMAEVYPFATNNVLLDHYRNADGVILYSRHDGWGLTVHEGLARGVPVLVSDTCGSAELVQQSGCGQVVPTKNVASLISAMSWFASLDPIERQNLGCAGRSIAYTLTMPKLAEELVGHCRTALSSR